MTLDLDALQKAWQQFVDRQVLAPDVNPLIANSWRRCRPRLNPRHQLRMKHLNPDHLLSVQLANFDLMSVSRPIMEDIHQYIENSDTAVVLVNNAGYILDMCGDEAMIETARQHTIQISALVTEGQMGTDAFSIPLYEGVPARVVGAEHYLEGLHSLAEVAAPTFSLTGRLLGTLGVISHAYNYHPHSLGLVVAGARAIEGQLQTARLLAEQNAQLSELNTILAALSDGVMVWDSEGVIMHANHMATELLDIPAHGWVGRPVTQYLSFPHFIEEALQEARPLRDVEANFMVGDRVVNCVVSLRFLQTGRAAPWVIVTLRHAEDVRQLVQRQMSAPLHFSVDDLVGDSPQIGNTRRLVKAAAPTHARILIRGESGTGKDLLARVIHNESPRSEGPFLIFSCLSIPTEYVLSELLGHDEGLSPRVPGGRPSKFELANSGTLLLQDVEALPLEAQTTILNVIDMGIVQRLGSARPIDVDVRIIASTSVELETKVAEGSFRADLYYRLSPFEIVLPPLRQRSDDLPLLVETTIKRLGRQRSRRFELAPEVFPLLQNYHWPGNIRELEAVLERAAIQAGPSEVIGPMHFPDYIRYPNTLPVKRGQRLLSLKEMEREAIIQAAELCDWRVTQMAKVLGIGRTTLWRRMREFNISPHQYQN